MSLFSEKTMGHSNPGDQTGHPASIMKNHSAGVIVLLLLAALIPLSHTLVPIEKFIHRGDDAFYYFQVAINYADVGHWTFDKVNATNGVQPLWAIILGAVAQTLDGIGVEDKFLAARIFVALAAIANIGAAFVLFHLLGRTVSVGTGLVAAGAFLVPLGIVWQRTWGMENSLYALLLLSTIAFYHLNFRLRPTPASALALGALLGLVALSRLNAGIFVPILLAHFLFATRARGFAGRFGLATLAGIGAAVFIVPYLAYNWVTTDHLLPVSGAAKKVYAQWIHSTDELVSPFAFSFWQDNGWNNLRHLKWFGTSRILDGMWVLGSRVYFGGNSSAPIEMFVGLLAVAVLLPAVIWRGSDGWLRFLWMRMRMLGAFWYVLVFGLANFLISILLYPHQLGYAITRWWWVENEIILSVIAATLSAALLSFLFRDIIRKTNYKALAVMGPLTLLVAFQATSHLTHYWYEDRRVYDWNRSGNDAWYHAADWLNEHVHEDELIGAWNAGVLGYYSDHRVVNLDGLINGFDYLPYFREGRIEDYVKDTGITYLADMESMFEIFKLPDQLEMEVVYDEYNAFYNKHFKIYKVVK